MQEAEDSVPQNTHTEYFDGDGIHIYQQRECTTMSVSMAELLHVVEFLWKQHFTTPPSGHLGQNHLEVHKQWLCCDSVYELPLMFTY